MSPENSPYGYNENLSENPNIHPSNRLQRGHLEVVQTPKQPVDFSSANSLVEIFEQLNTLREQGKQLIGSRGELDTTDLAEAIIESVDEIQRDRQLGNSRVPGDISRLLEQRGITGAGGLRRALTQIIEQSTLRGESLLQPKVYQLFGEIEGTAEVARAERDVREEAQRSADRERAESRQAIESWKAERRQAVYLDTELVPPTLSDKRQYLAVENWIRDNRDEAFKKFWADDGSRTLGYQLKSFMQQQVPADRKFDGYEATTNLAHLRGDNGATDTRVTARTFQVSLGIANRHDMLITVLSDQLHNSAMEDPYTIKGVVIEAINGELIDDLVRDPASARRVGIARESLFTQAGNLDQDITQQFGFNIGLEATLRDKLGVPSAPRDLPEPYPPRLTGHATKGGPIFPRK